MVKYKLRYLPLAQKDLLNIIDYISNDLKASGAAMDFIDILDETILRLKEFPFSCSLYRPQKPLETEYRYLPVKNFIIFYIVLENIVEIHRIVYAKMDLNEIFP